MSNKVYDVIEELNSTEKNLITFILILISILVAVDVVDDLRSGVGIFHFTIEVSILILSLISIWVLLKDRFYNLKKINFKKSEIEKRNDWIQKLESEKKEWQKQNEVITKNLSEAINNQLTDWQLTDSEKEVARLLLKGISLKEIAAIRNTTEKTARAQSVAIYQKTGLSGRSELSAYFLEDLLKK